ncbi:nicotinate (nicotinamide) nucleotide adenylyltransferase [Plebeiibacterium marinum]|uniref:Probable nicotinate-nucleotide adenylyltransferase n=1 Tax=Plebeiibacterium marinum TaxID=2992111 RepID=A0AAE3MBE2_9BACT|nr:nicotinate (nicotinamide) nucleotide adenylyltransferase [Plebeiobacterium marinum]MCW3804686.1 nicotinate (nicotinamide) nucleotide adenylyltransferase [Plebeiobacterium marinum]
MPDSKKNTGLFFGSFNPVHVGHLALANYIIENTELEEIWFVVSPQNPFKQSHDLIAAEHRIKMLELSIENDTRFKICDIELNLPIPSYSYKTIRELYKLYPDHSFSIIMGSDNLLSLSRWKNIEDILQRCPIKVYPRPEYPIGKIALNASIEVIEAPVFNIASTTLRKGIKQGKDYRYLLPQQAFEYIKLNGLYLK